MNLLFKIKRKFYKLTHPALGEVLMLHRVTSQRSVLHDNRILEITPDFLEQTILNYKSQGYRLVSLDEVYSQLTAKQKFKQKFVCFTLDDGFRDNYETAYPIFKKHNCPFAIYLTTDFPNKKALLWWYILEDILLKNDKIELSDGTTYKCCTIQEKNDAFLAIRKKIFDVQSDDMLNTLNNLFGSNAFYYDTDNKYVLSWEQVKTLSEDELCTIASHTLSHPALTKLPEKEIIYELAASKKMIEAETEKKVLHFAYPYGNQNENVVELLKQVGYKTGMLANGGVSRKGDNVWKLKRNILIEKCN